MIDMEPIDKVIKFIKSKWEIDITHPLNSNTSLTEIGIDGDDAEELIKEFVKVFNIDDADFSFYDYFSAELDLSNIFKRILNKPIPPKKRFTLYNLEEAIKKGKLL